MTDPIQAQAEQAARVKQEKLEQERTAEDFRKLLETQWGRRIVWRLLESAGVFRSAFSPNALEMAKAEGRREYGLFWLNEMMNVTPDKFVAMLNEREAKNASD